MGVVSKLGFPLVEVLLREGGEQISSAHLRPSGAKRTGRHNVHKTSQGLALGEEILLEAFSTKGLAASSLQTSTDFPRDSSELWKSFL